MGKHRSIEEKLCKELEELDEKYRDGGALTEADLKVIDTISHALKCLATYDAMKDAEEYGYSGDTSDGGRRMSGRYMSRDMGPWRRREDRWVADGYSGHYPPYPYEDRNW